MKPIFLLIISLISSLLVCNAQPKKPTRIELLHADFADFDQSINSEAQRLIGNVSFKHENAFMYCDSAYLYKDKNNLEAFSHVRIVQGDSVTLRGKRLYYNGNTQMANVFDDVVMTDSKMTLNTSRLDYDMNRDIASYNDSAHIVDADNVLTSKLGYFFSNTHDLFFRKDVILVNPRYTMTCDTLRYNTLSKISYFLGPTFIQSKENLIYCENGWYNTDKQTSSFYKNAYLKTKTQILKGDTVYYDRNNGIGKGFGNVSVNDSVNKVIISGEYAEHHEVTDSSFVTGKAMMTQIFDTDSLFLHGDTLMAIADQKTIKTDTSRNKKRDLFAFHHVKLYKNDLQGTCDSLVYNYRDSTIKLFRNPVLWSGLNQLTADSVTIQTENSEITKMYLVNSAFIVSRADSAETGIVDSLRFNQIRGKNMTGLFTKNKLYRINVEGNGQTIYYAKNKAQKDFGVNRADCSDLVIFVDENKVNKIILLKEPDGTLYPIRELSPKDLRLKGFTWKNELRPMTREDIFKTSSEIIKN